MKIFNTPIVLFVFNRPDLSQQVFDEIRKVKPKDLLIVSDGPRQDVESDFASNQECKELVDQVDWDCNLITDFSEHNLGCGKRISSGLNKAFELYEKAIILEDDCLPHPDFFPYCDYLLEKYKDDEKVFHISGSQNQPIDIDDDYYFTSLADIWGWASWRRAWKYYDIYLTNWQNDERKLRSDFMHLPQEIDRLLGRISKTISKSRDTWDYQWLATVLINQGYSISPAKSLIHNIGFDERATHTLKKPDYLNELEMESLEFPLKEPATRLIDPKLEKITFSKFRNKSKFEKFKRSLKKRLSN